MSSDVCEVENPRSDSGKKYRVNYEDTNKAEHGQGFFEFGGLRLKLSTQEGVDGSQKRTGSGDRKNRFGTYCFRFLRLVSHSVGDPTFVNYKCELIITDHGRGTEFLQLRKWEAMKVMGRKRGGN